MKSFFQTFFTLIVSFSALAQTGEVKGTIVDDVTKEPVVGAKVVLSEQFRSITGVDGTYVIKEVPYGTYTLTATMLSFDTLTYEVKVNKPVVIQDIIMGGSQELKEIQVIGNLVDNGRVTPIAVTTVSREDLTEKLGSRDLPMVLNGTPGVYATQTGGGDGDARINIRGFDQRNIGVLIDGVPVNDMENGWVYWSNWFGLDVITSTMQVQRGLGATKLALPSVGGTINIITQGIGSRKGLFFKQEYGTGNFLRSTLAYNTGLMKNGFGVTATASYKQGNGWVDGTYTQGFFGYLKLQKRLGKHLLSASAFAAPQEHGQRSYNQQIQYWDAETAQKLGVAVDSSAIYDRGVRFNQHYGYITNENGKKELKSERVNYYNKPQFTLKDFWVVNKKLSISNIAYMSIGRGGGTRLLNDNGIFDSTGHVDWDMIVQNNQQYEFFGQTYPTVDPLYSNSELKSNNVLVSSVNNHYWLGYLGQFEYDINKKYHVSGGLDYRYYKGTHYQEIADLLGGDYYVNTTDKNASTPMKREGDKIALQAYNDYRDAIVNWAGAFGTFEYVGSRWTYFVNASGIVNGYKGIDYFKKRELDLGDTTLKIGYNDTVTYNGNTYTRDSDGLHYNETSMKWIPGGTIKIGGSFTIDEYQTVFVNAGYLSRTPLFSNVIDNNTNTFFGEILNEKILAFEGGYTYARKRFGIHLNGYFTNWQNKPFPFGVSVPDPNDPTENIRINVNGMDAIHLGGELDIAYKISKMLSAEFMGSLGDWRWNSSETVTVPQYNNFTFTFDAKGVHVGDAAQTAVAASLRLTPFKGYYIKLEWQYFDRYYAQFSPFTLQGENGGRDAWKLPAYRLVNLYTGYKFRAKGFDMFINGNIINVLNTKYISDATDNYYPPKNSDAQSASVMFGQGFRFNLSLGIQF